MSDLWDMGNGIERDWIFQEFLIAVVFPIDSFPTEIHSSMLTLKLLHHYLCKSCTQTLPRVASPVLVGLPGGISLQTTRGISEVWAKNGYRWDFHSWCAQLKTSVTLHWNRWGKGQMQIAVSYHWHPHTNTADHCTPCGTDTPAHVTFMGQAFCRISKSLVMAITLTLHAWHLLWGWAIQNWFKDLKQQNITGVNHVSGLVLDEETEFACLVLSYSSLTSKCRVTPLLL